MPLTDDDLRRLCAETGRRWRSLVHWVPRKGIDFDDPRWFVELRQGPRIMILTHRQGRCIYLGPDDRCTAYPSRPLGCRIYPFDPEFTRSGRLHRLALIEATACPSARDGENPVAELRALHVRYEAANDAYLARVAAWNRTQRQRRRRGLAPETARAFMTALGLET